MKVVSKVNDAFAASFVGRYFKVGERKSSLTTEIRAGIVTFLTLAYIISINSNIVSSSGGPCSSQDCTGPDKSFDCRFTDPGYQSCVDEVKINLITATAASSLIGCAFMGSFANLPLAIAPGMGVNAYFTYNVVGYYGTGSVPYKDALAAIFIEGWIFILLSVTGARQFLIKLLPQTLALAMSAGIGLFLAYIGLQSSEGIGAITADGATLGTLGGCPVDNRVVSYFIPSTDVSSICTPPPGALVPNLPAPSSNYMCLGHKMSSPELWLGLAGLFLMCVLMSRNFKGAIIVGILFTTIIAWIPGHGGSYLGKTSNLPGGIGGTGPARWDYFKKVVAAPTLSKTGAALNFSGMGSGDVWVALITFLYVDFFDTTGTLFSMARFIDGYIPGFIDENKNFPRSIFAYCADGISIVVGSLMGTSPLTVFIESATGIREGGRTGITALTTGFCFFISMFFAPLLASIPVFATGPALILVGALMLANAAKIDWQDINKAVPAFLTIVVMPLSYSIAYGVIAGIVSYTLLQCTAKALDFLSDHTNGAFGRAQRHVEVGDDKLADVIDHPKMDALAFKEQGEDTAHNGVKQPKEEV